MNRSPDFNEFPDWVCWFAQDANGIWWGYEVEPNMSHNGWYENEVGRCIELRQAGALVVENAATWRRSIRRVKRDISGC